MSRRFCTSSLSPVEVSVSLARMQAAEQSPPTAAQLIQLLHLFQDCLSSSTSHWPQCPALGGDLEALGLPRKGTGLRAVPREVQCRDHAGIPLPQGRIPSQKKLFHSLLLPTLVVRILPYVSPGSFCLLFKATSGPVPWGMGVPVSTCLRPED